MGEHVLVERQGEILALTLNRPDRRNAITVAMYDTLANAIGAAKDDPAIRAIVIRGEGRDLTAGNDLADFLTALPRDLGDDIPVWRLLRVLAECETPLIAAAHGNCVGIGTTMLLHCDLVIAGEGARFSLPFVELGLVPEAASSLLLPEIAGRRHAARYLLLGETFGAQEALAMGIASHVAPQGTLAEKLEEVVARLLRQPAEALRQSQKLLRSGRRDEIVERMRAESDCFAERLQSDEVKQAIAAFFQARAAKAQA